MHTFQPHAPPIVLASKHDFEGFAALEISQRARFGLPPARRMARLVVRDAGETRCAELAERLAADIRPHAGAATTGSIEVRGPSPCPIARIAVRYRQQIEIFADGAAELRGIRPGEVDVRARRQVDRSEWKTRVTAQATMSLALGEHATLELVDEGP